MTDTSLWTQRVADWQASGLSALAYARSKHFPATELRKWSRTLAAKPEARAAAASVTMARVIPVGGPLSQASSASLVVEVADARIVVPPNFDGRALRSVIAILESRRGPS